MRNFLVIFLIVTTLLSCSLKETKPEKEVKQTKIVKKSKPQPSMAQRIYYFQHRLLPQWTFRTNGAFYNDLIKGNLTRLKAAANEVVSLEFSSSISSRKWTKMNGVLITFPSPKNPGDCFFIFIRKVNNNFFFITYEKTIDITNRGYIGVVAQWTKNRHRNFGPRKYKDSKSFLSDAIRIE